MSEREFTPSVTVAAIVEHQGRYLFIEELRGGRNVLNDLRPGLLDDLGLLPALRSLVAEFGERLKRMGGRVAEPGAGDVFAGVRERLLSGKLSKDEAKVALTGLAFTKSAAAATTMVELALDKNFVHRELANWWLQSRKGNDWKEFDVEKVMKLRGLYDPAKAVVTPVDLLPEAPDAKPLGSVEQIAALKGDAARGVRLRIEHDLGMHHAVRRGTVEIGSGQIMEVGARAQHVDGLQLPDVHLVGIDVDHLPRPEVDVRPLAGELLRQLRDRPLQALVEPFEQIARRIVAQRAVDPGAALVDRRAVARVVEQAQQRVERPVRPRAQQVRVGQSQQRQRRGRPRGHCQHRRPGPAWAAAAMPPRLPCPVAQLRGALLENPAQARLQRIARVVHAQIALNSRSVGAQLAGNRAIARALPVSSIMCMPALARSTE